MSTILLVDDDEMVQGVTTELLVILGYQVLNAIDGGQALERIGEAEQPIDLVLLDLSLPDLPGEELIPRLLAARPDLKILLCTGNIYDAEQVALQQPGVAGILRKPFNLQSLRETLQRLLP